MRDQLCTCSGQFNIEYRIVLIDFVEILKCAERVAGKWCINNAKCGQTRGT